MNQTQASTNNIQPGFTAVAVPSNMGGFIGAHGSNTNLDGHTPTQFHNTHGERINHSSPIKANVPIGNASGIGGVIGSQTGMQGISGVKPTMTQTSKNFNYNMHRKANSNKLPHIPSSSGKDGTGQ
jgi:hypothetical protein